MKILNAKQSMDIPDGVECKVKARVVTIKGPRGTLVRSFRHLAIDIYMEGPTKLTVSNFSAYILNMASTLFRNYIDLASTLFINCNILMVCIKRHF